MSKFVIEGGNKLSGEIAVGGSKNAALAVMAACLLTEETCEIENVPDILDVRNFLEILKHLGAEAEFADHRLRITAKNLTNRPIDAELMGRLRGSILLAGALLARFGQVQLAHPGGDAIGRRPIDAHLDGFRKLGAEVSQQESGIQIRARKLQGARIVMGVTSVTGTENLILASILAQGPSEIRLAATEPHVRDLCDFLKLMGADIEGIGTPFLRITGQVALHGAKFTICSDEINAVTYAIAAAVTRGHVVVKNSNLENLDAPLATLERMGVKYEVRSDGSIEILESMKPYAGTKIVTGVFPQLLTDEQPLFGVLATQARGETSIHDWIWEGRQGYLKALVQMGAKVQFDDIHRARITGPTQLHGAEIKTPDLRAGASILIASLIAKGRSVIYNAEIIDRGYERLDEKLRSLGAKIQRIE